MGRRFMDKGKSRQRNISSRIRLRDGNELTVARRSASRLKRLKIVIISSTRGGGIDFKLALCHSPILLVQFTSDFNVSWATGDQFFPPVWIGREGMGDIMHTVQWRDAKRVGVLLKFLVTFFVYTGHCSVDKYWGGCRYEFLDT